MSKWLKTSRSSRFRLGGVDRKCGVVATAGMSYMVGTSSQGLPIDGQIQIKDQRCMNRYGGVEARRWLPSS